MPDSWLDIDRLIHHRGKVIRQRRLITCCKSFSGISADLLHVADESKFSSLPHRNPFPSKPTHRHTILAVILPISVATDINRQQQSCLICLCLKKNDSNHFLPEAGNGTTSSENTLGGVIKIESGFNKLKKSVTMHYVRVDREEPYKSS